MTTVYISHDGIDDIECELVDGVLYVARIGSFTLDLTSRQRREIHGLAIKEANRLLDEERDELKAEKYLGGAR